MKMSRLNGLAGGYEHADRLDPLKNNQMKNLIEQFRRRNDESIEDGSMRLEELLWRYRIIK